MAEVADATKPPEVQPSGIRARACQLVHDRTPWKESREVECTAASGEQVLLPGPAPLHLPSHGFCLFAYAALLAAFSAYSLVAWATEEPVTTYSTEPATEFEPQTLNISIDCAACTPHAVRARQWVVEYDYRDFEHCAAIGNASLIDQVSTTARLCRTTDDIADFTAPRVVLENVSEALRLEPGYGRPVVRISAGDFVVETPLEHWHEKTLLLGVVAHRDVDSCTSAANCNLDLGLYLASMQYDGKVTWGGVGWGGARLNLRLLRFAQVHTTRRRPLVDVLSSIGGASTMLIAVLGALRKLLEVLMSGGVFKKEDGAETTIAIGSVAVEAVAGEDA